MDDRGNIKDQDPHAETSRILWEYFVQVLNTLMEGGENSRSLGKKLTVHWGTVARWAKGERGGETPGALAHYHSAFGQTGGVYG